MRKLLVLLPLLVPTPVLAEAITFEGEVEEGCTIALDTPGSLNLNTDRDAMTSEVAAGGAPALVIISASAATQLHIDSPTLEASGAGYNVGSQTLEVSYDGLIGLSLVHKDFSTTGGSYPILSILPSVLTMNNRILNPEGFPPGTYRTQTMVTCGP